jgi:hypothetical protein
VSDKEILETYLNSASKNAPETDFFLPHRPKSLLAGVICVLHNDTCNSSDCVMLNGWLTGGEFTANSCNSYRAITGSNV